ncbi:TonB-dependent receptor [Novosphingobium sp. PS1R-30]|uniref:TonB-dependent receptor n=1 Tax=Novosphingobium anseongense TaxID=3133436 RepID=A0ABU8S2Q9_9SPHN
MRVNSASLLAGGLIAAATGWTPQASAQTAAGETAASEGRLEEIVVTAQRRRESLQDVPIAASAIAGSALEGKAVDRLADLQFATPGLSVTDAGETQSVNIRGIGLSSNLPSVTNGVATYVDGLFQAQIVGAVPFYDIASVEVLRGPQGTLVGNNSTGGAIFVNSASPELGTVSGYAQASYGNYDRLEAEGAVNLPLGDTLALRLAGIARRRDSFYTDVGAFDNDAGKLDEQGGRLGILWKPGAFQALLKLQYHNAESGGFAYRPAPGTTFAPGLVGDERTLSYDVPTSQAERAFSAALELRYEFAGGVTLRSLSGYQFKRNRYSQDTDATQIPIAPTGGLVVDYLARDRQYSEEINLISPTDGRFDWILGGYFQKNDIYVDFLQRSPTPNVAYLPRQTRDIWGVFGQGNYAMTEALELQLGLRYSHVKTSGTGAVILGAGEAGFPPAGIPVADLSGAHSDARLTGKAALNWKLDADNLIYAFAARGYKPGGFNSATTGFAPETVWDYEIGWKSTFADGRLRTQIGAFYNDYSNLQLDVLDPATGVNAVQNVGHATIKGLEAQAQARFGGLGLDLGVSYVDSRLDGLSFINTRLLPPGTLGPQCPAGVAANPPFCFDYAPFATTTGGGPNLYSPKWTYNAGLEYRFDLGETRITPRVNFGYVGPRFNYVAYGPGDRLAGRGLLSALLTIEHDGWRVEAYGTNLTDKTYVSGRSGDNEFYGAPREYGLRLGVRF